MRRLFMIPALGALALLVSSVPAPAGRARRPLAKATLVACHHALAPADRYAKFRGDMRSLKRNVRLSISFELLEKTPSSNGYQRVQAPDLGTWSEADQGVGHYVYKKTGGNLDAPASYIGVMHFRWTDANGKITRTATKRTSVCHQPDLRPNLVVGAMT